MYMIARITHHFIFGSVLCFDVNKYKITGKLNVSHNYFSCIYLKGYLDGTLLLYEH